MPIFYNSQNVHGVSKIDFLRNRHCYQLGEYASRRCACSPKYVGLAVSQRAFIFFGSTGDQVLCRLHQRITHG
jgi:hypothetical protein